MAIRRLFIITLLLAATVFAQDLKELDWSEGTGIIPLFDDPTKSLLIVESTVKNLSFDSGPGIYSADQAEPGIWHVILEPGSQYVTIKADDFLPLQLPRFNYARRKARKIKVFRKTPDELPVMIRAEPTSAEVRIDGKRVDVSKSLKLAVGKHDIEIIKSGYVTIREQFTVNEDNIFFEYTLGKPKLCIVEVTTNPPGAEVEIDGVKLNGVTPVSDFYNSGNYTIRITRDKYLPVEETIKIDPSKKKNSFSYTLESNTGTIVIASDPEVNMEITMNGQTVGKTPLTLKEQEVGDYTLTGVHEFYTAEPISFTLDRGETYRATLKAEENFAVLTINTTPGATVYLNGKRLQTLRGLRLTPQTARLRAEKPKCEPVETTLILKRGARDTVDLYLNEQLGTIAISVDPVTAAIELNGDAGEHFTATGTNIFENIPVGGYEVKVSAKGYKTARRSLLLGPDETLRERITLEEGTASEGPLPGMVFVEIPAGSFLMGSPSNEEGRDDDEGPQHRVTIRRPFQMMTTEVTQAQWKAVMGNNPSNFKGDDRPVEQVSWNDVQKFIRKLNQRDPGKGYRLPTEAEWEYACRAGTTTRFYTGDRDSNLDRAGWYSGNSGGNTHPVGQKQPNGWGLYDMHGNVWEWCQDWYGAYPNGSVTDPRGPSSGTGRVSRGGGWYDGAGGCRSANRSNGGPSLPSYDSGFRLVRSEP